MAARTASLSVPLAVYDETIDLLKSAVTWAKLGNDDKLDALRRRDAQATRMERDASGPALAAFIDADTYAGRSVFG